MSATPRADTLLPIGTVTFLVTDVEGSTRLWEAHRAAMQLALARHDALLRQCIEGHGGHVVKSVGDGVCAAFVSATDALEASVDAQHALATEPWPEPIRIRVRMALHSGPAELRDGDYFGPTLNRVARLVALGRGGQTLVSAITYDLCRHYLPEKVSLRSLGQHTLKDLDRPEAVFEVTDDRSPKVVPQPQAPLAASQVNPPSIAVLPFVNLSGDEENEYFADGLAEELLNVLSKIRGLRVASRTSAFYFKGKDIDIPTVARKLNVATILEGSVRKSGKRVRISAQLIQVATDSHLWAETYDRELDDIFAVQDDIAQSVVKELRAALLAEKPDPLASAAVKAEVNAAAKGRSENAEAYRLYLQGRFLVDRRTRKDMAQGLKYLRHAIELDSEYALAWAALAYAQAIEAGVGWTSYEKGYRHARDAAERALALEPDLAEGHVVLGHVRMGYDWDWKGADASSRRALELAPRNADVVLAAAFVAGSLGRLDESIVLSRRVIVLDPLNVQGHRYLGMFSLFAGFLEQAEAALKEALELNPLGGMTYEHLGEVYLAQGRFAEALAVFKKESFKELRLLGMSVAYHALGREAQSSASLEQLSELPLHAIAIARGNAYRGNVDQAFEWLERAYTQRNAGLCQIKVQPLLRNLHSDPRWQPFLEKMGLAR
ncbi:MAG TPA: adenylate/guanylate cyclase domain-containing protein [Casimicrobiaceae bacterium]|jgi:TolB-like protein/Tfp pilus assembly protein PilF|nr:adenylate/guanylate cyclase domain-containing protein [Casimicrobiaceae bacterium]